jgi:hypothetical protein
MLQDLKYGFRQLVRQPGFTAVALPTLAVGLGASIATFSVFDGALLRPALFPQSDRLVVPYITATAPNGLLAGSGGPGGASRCSPNGTRCSSVWAHTAGRM